MNYSNNFVSKITFFDGIIENSISNQLNGENRNFPRYLFDQSSNQKSFGIQNSTATSAIFNALQKATLNNYNNFVQYALPRMYILRS